MADLKKNIDYEELIDRIGNTYQSAKSKIVSAVNTEMLHAYWQIGKDIIEFEQGESLKPSMDTTPGKLRKGPFVAVWARF